MLERELAQARQYGIARDNEELELGVRCMAAGIYDDQSKLVAGLSISAPADRLDEAWLERAASHCQRRSPSALGHRTPTSALPSQNAEAGLRPAVRLGVRSRAVG